MLVSLIAMMHATLHNWIRREAIPFSVDSSETLNASIDKVIASLGDSVELLGLGEALHGGEEILRLDLDSITPREAHNKLAEYQKRLLG